MLKPSEVTLRICMTFWKAGVGIWISLPMRSVPDLQMLSEAPRMRPLRAPAAMQS